MTTISPFAAGKRTALETEAAAAGARCTVSHREPDTARPIQSPRLARRDDVQPRGGVDFTRSLISWLRWCRDQRRSSR